MAHKQKMIKVNAYVDEGIADLIEVLNGFKKIRTIESCEGKKESVILFTYDEGNLNTMAEFVFKFLAPRVIQVFAGKIDVLMRMNTQGNLQGELLIEKFTLQEVCDYLKVLVYQNTKY